MSRIRLGRRLTVGAFVGLTLVVFALPAQAAAGDLDPSWGGTGVVTTPFTPGVNAFANGVVARDGTVVAVGGVQSGVTMGDFAIARYRYNGTLDPTFGSGGKVVTDFSGFNDLATAVAYQGDRIVVVGYAQPSPGVYDFAIARYLNNGSLDPTFGSGGKVMTPFSGPDDEADAVSVFGDRILVAGAVSGPGGHDFGLARYLKNGTLDSSFGSSGKVRTDFGGNDVAHGVTFFFNGGVVAAGYTSSGIGYDFALAGYRYNGSLDPNFGTGGLVRTDFAGGNDFGTSLALDWKGIVVGGWATVGSQEDFAAARYDWRGRLDPSFNGTGKATMNLLGNDEAFGVAVQDGYVVLAGGNYGDIPSQFEVARFTPQGQFDPTFGGGDGWVSTPVGTDSSAFSVALDPHQKIVAAGFSDDNFAVVRYQGDVKGHCREHGGGDGSSRSSPSNGDGCNANGD